MGTHPAETVPSEGESFLDNVGSIARGEEVSFNAAVRSALQKGKYCSYDMWHTHNFLLYTVGLRPEHVEDILGVTFISPWHFKSGS